MTDHTTPAPAHKEMGALQVTVLAGISPQPGSLRFQMGTAADQIEAEDHVVTLHAVTHTTPDRPYRLTHELMPDGMTISVPAF